MRFWFAVLAVALAACAPNDGATQAGGAIAAPTPAGVRQITAADAGKTIAVKTGERIAVALVGIPTAGYVWAAAETPPFLVADGEAGGPTSEAQRQPGFAGGTHWEVLFFKVEAAGEGTVRLVQRRPWETDEPPAETFEVKLRAE